MELRLLTESFVTLDAPPNMPQRPELRLIVEEGIETMEDGEARLSRWSVGVKVKMDAVGGMRRMTYPWFVTTRRLREFCWRGGGSRPWSDVKLRVRDSEVEDAERNMWGGSTAGTLN